MAGSECHRTPFNSALLTTSIFFVCLATGSVVLRLLASRRADGRGWHHSDTWLLVSALVFCYGYLIQTICGCATTGINCYRSDIDETWATHEVMKILWTDLFLLTPASALVKIGILEFRKRVFTTSRCKWICNFLVFACAGWAISAVVGQGFSTTPLSASWDPSESDDYHNYNYRAFLLAIAAINVVLDLSILVLPMPTLVQLHMSLERKLKVLGILVLGSFALVCSSLRLYYLYISFKRRYRNTTDRLIIEGHAAMWGRMEPAVLVLAGSLPTFSPLIASYETVRSIVDSATSVIRSARDSIVSKPWPADDIAGLRSERSSAEASCSYWRDYHGGNLAHHHCSIHSDPRPNSHAAPNTIEVTNEYSVDRETSRDEDEKRDDRSISSGSSES